MTDCALTRPGRARAAVALDPAAAMTVAGYTPDGWQTELIRSATTHRQNIVVTSRQSGKALALDTPLPTPTGWTTMGEVSEGERLFDERGEPCAVTAIHDIVTRDCWRVTFSDRTHLDASGDHLWSVLNLSARNSMRTQSPTGPISTWASEPLVYGRWKQFSVGHSVVTTDDMRTRGLNRGRDRQFAIPTTQPLNLPDADLPIDPWLLGFWLGNGNTGGGGLSAHCDDADEVLRRVSDLGFDVRSVATFDDRCCVQFLPVGLHSRLRELGVLGNKHIPVLYLRASVKQRLELLRGLMDSDGYGDPAENQSDVEWSTTSPHLADGFEDLAAGLGCRFRRAETRATLYGKDCGPCWRFGAVTPFNPFALPRKSSTWSDDIVAGFRPFGRTIRSVVSIERLPDQPTRCIEVDSPSRLYLAGRGMIPTHNTTSVAALIAGEMVRRAGTRVLCLAPSQRQSSLILERVGEFLAPYGEPATRSSRSEIQLLNGSVVYAVPASSSTIRGYHSIDLLCLDESAWVPEPAYAAVRPMTATVGGRIVATSTPGGQRGWYWQAWDAGASAGWYKIEVPCTRVHRLDREFLLNEARSVPPSVFRSEYLCSFEDSSDALFLPAVLRRAQVVAEEATDDEVFSFADFVRSGEGSPS